MSPAAERVLTLRELNRATLARQLLLDFDAWSMMRMPQLEPALERLEPVRRFREEHGRVAGIWRVEDGRVAVEPFSAVPRSVKRELDDEAGRLEAFLAD